MTAPLTQEFDTVRKVLAPGSREDAALSVIERHLHDMETALLAVFVDPLGSHGARALARETLGIPFIPFATPEKMLAAHEEEAPQ